MISYLLNWWRHLGESPLDALPDDIRQEEEDLLKEWP